ncbi:ribosome maturation factor RimM [Kordiimonas aquimaris]|uniref:ribosome maturation factor RimM n=1 Tax=Kordiimonas aquimaris TaxID=707591 RepID=UPI0021CE6094|nr:ribosome maturation factor RimM [Kordiimonas aquimaris]
MAKAVNTYDKAGVDGDWICVGALAAPHGVKGDVRLKSFTENPVSIFKFKDLRLGADGKAILLSKKAKNKDGFIVHIDGFDTPEAAAAFSGKQLYIRRDFLPQAADDEYYLTDLIGLEARDEHGTRIGVVEAVENFGAEDLIELILDEPVKGLGRFALIPFRKLLVPTVDIKGGFLTVAFTDWQETQTGKQAESQMDQGGSS